MSDRTIPTDTVASMLEQVAPEWRLRDATLADSGFLRVYHLEVETPEGPRTCVLKASLPGEDNGVALEARVLAGLAAHTGVPVPEVYGAVDDHGDLPAPYFLMAAMPGESVPREAMGTLSPAAFERIARQLGGHLADLHAVDAVDAFGFLAAAPDEPLRGAAPAGDFADVTTVDPGRSWPACLRDWVDAALDGVADTRFADVSDRVAPVLHERVDALEGPFDPALGHVDASIENVLLDADRDVVGVLDWAFTLAVPPAYDLVLVEHALAGGHWAKLPGAPDVREPVRSGLVAGYRERGSERALRQFRAHHDCYELLALVHAMVHFEDWYADRDVDEERVAAAAENHRAAVDALL